MTIYVQDNGDAKALKKNKADSKNQDKLDRRSSRSGGFRRKQPPKHELDALVDSGADAPETEPVVPAPAPASDAEEAPEKVEVPGHMEAPPAEVLADEEPPVEDTPTGDVPEAEPAPVGGQEPTVKFHIDPSVLGQQEPATGKRPARPAANKFVKNSGKASGGASTKQKRKADATKNKFVNGKAPAKKRAPAKEATPSDVHVVVAPESIGSQLVTLLEVVAGAALMFFGASQIGGILINQIVSGMLGG